MVKSRRTIPKRRITKKSITPKRRITKKSITPKRMRRRSGGEGTTSIAEAKEMVGDYICMVLAYNAYFNNNKVSDTNEITNLKKINSKHYDKWCLNMNNCKDSKKQQSPTDQSNCYTAVTSDVTRYLNTKPLLTSLAAKPENVELFKNTINQISDRFKTQFDKSINNIEKLTQGIKTTEFFSLLKNKVSLLKNKGYGMQKSQDGNDRRAKEEIYNHIKESSTILLSLILEEKKRVPTEETTKEEIFRKKFYEDNNNNNYEDKMTDIIKNAETKANANTQ
jgi:hypothetical protein